VRVLVFGDSIAQGYWDDNGGWVQRIRKEFEKDRLADQANLQLDVPWVFNLGISGDNSRGLLERIEGEIVTRNTNDSTIVIAIGTNDAQIKDDKTIIELSEYRENLKKILDICKDNASKILFVGLGPCIDKLTYPIWDDGIGWNNSTLLKFDKSLEKFCKDNNQEYVKIYDKFKAEMTVKELLPDGVHPNAAGHELIAEIVSPRLGSLLSE